MDEKKMPHNVTDHLTEGALLAWLDGDPAANRPGTEAHLAGCPTCRAAANRLQAERERVRGALGALGPAPRETAHHKRAMARLSTEIDRYEEKPMLKRMGSNETARRWLAAAAAVVVVAGLLALPPVRAAAHDFLSLFRVEQFVALNVDMEQIEALADALESSGFGEDGMLIDMEEPVPVASVDEAAAVAGFTPRQPEGYGAPTEVLARGTSTSTITPDVEMLRGVFTAMGIDPMALPDNIDGQPFDVTVPGTVFMSYEGSVDTERDDLVVVQTLAPSVDVPEGVDVDALGVAMLQLLGMEEDEATRLSNQIDWTTTMVVPIPSEIVTVGEVRVDETTGLLFDETRYDDLENGEGSFMVVWQKNGVVHVVAGSAGSAELVAIADSLE